MCIQMPAAILMLNFSTRARVLNGVVLASQPMHTVMPMRQRIRQPLWEIGMPKLEF
jgi:hypothetical protein